MAAWKITAAAMQNDEAALAYLEALLWPNGPICPHCGATERIDALKGKSTRPGVTKCGHCRKQFTVTVGTVFERSHVPLHKWVQAIHLLCSSKKGISAHQLHRMLGVTYKTAWFMAHRIREAMRDGEPRPAGRLRRASSRPTRPTSARRTIRPSAQAGRSAARRQAPGRRLWSSAAARFAPSTSRSQQGDGRTHRARERRPRERR